LTWQKALTLFSHLARTPQLSQGPKSKEHGSRSQGGAAGNWVQVMAQMTLNYLFTRAACWPFNPPDCQLPFASYQLPVSEGSPLFH